MFSLLSLINVQFGAGYCMTRNSCGHNCRHDDRFRMPSHEISSNATATLYCIAPACYCSVGFPPWKHKNPHYLYVGCRIAGLNTMAAQNSTNLMNSQSGAMNVGDREKTPRESPIATPPMMPNRKLPSRIRIMVSV